MGKADTFSEWCNEIVEKVGLIDKRYPIKGMDVSMPYGWSVMRAIDTRAEMARTDPGGTEARCCGPHSESAS